MFLETNDRTFGTDIHMSGWTIVDLCAPASSGVQAPILRQFAAQHPDIRVLTVDARRNPQITKSFNVQRLPALVFFKDGHPLLASSGVQHAYAIERLFKAAEARANRIGQA